jgi:hypothetical protein
MLVNGYETRVLENFTRPSIPVFFVTSDVKKKVLIVSVLKPVNDARNYEKTGISLANAGFMVGIAGRNLSTLPISHPGTEFLPWFQGHRLHWKRLFSGWIFLINALKWKPQVIVLTTWELLPAALWLKLFTRATLVYDVQENYFRNLWYSRIYPPVFRHLLALSVRFVELTAQWWVDQFWVAEKAYTEEISWLKKALILENKARKPSSLNAPTFPVFTYLYSGNISENYGVKEAIIWFLEKKKIDPTCRLIIAGYAPQHSFFRALREQYGSEASIQWEGGDTLVPHARILELIQQCHAGIISYLPDKSTENCIPTKLYEYLAYGLEIILLSENERWKFVREKFQHSKTDELFWENQEKLLVESLTVIQQ